MFLFITITKPFRFSVQPIQYFANTNIEAKHLHVFANEQAFQQFVRGHQIVSKQQHFLMLTLKENVLDKSFYQAFLQQFRANPTYRKRLIGSADPITYYLPNNQSKDLSYLRQQNILKAEDQHFIAAYGAALHTQQINRFFQNGSNSVPEIVKGLSNSIKSGIR